MVVWSAFFTPFTSQYVLTGALMSLVIDGFMYQVIGESQTGMDTLVSLAQGVLFGPYLVIIVGARVAGSFLHVVHERNKKE